MNVLEKKKLEGSLLAFLLTKLSGIGAKQQITGLMNSFKYSGYVEMELIFPGI